jgi:osmotically-inducible protein OsmY
MNKPKQMIVKAAALLLSSSATLWSGAVLAESQEERDTLTSQRVQDEIAREMQEHNESGQVLAPLVVQAQGGVVTVSGKVATHRAEQHVLVAAGGTPGVTYVRNELRVLQ